MISNIIKILQAELLDELDIINKDYELDDIPSVILLTFQNITKERIKKNLPIKENNILKDSKSIFCLYNKDSIQWFRKIKNKIKGIKKNENDYYN